MKRVQAKDLKVGSIVQTMEGAFGTSIVKQVTDERVTFFRPYGITTDFTYGGNQTICYTGIEEWEIPRDDVEYFVYREGNLR